VLEGRDSVDSAGNGGGSGWQRGFIEGFLTAFLNPKIFVFLTAIFSQFIAPGMPLLDRLLVSSIALTIDAGWYVIVARRCLLHSNDVNEVSKH